MDLGSGNGCAFVNRCPLREEVCWFVSPNQYVRGHRVAGEQFDGYG